jgi:hypothetical protein
MQQHRLKATALAVSRKVTGELLVRLQNARIVVAGVVVVCRETGAARQQL